MKRIDEGLFSQDRPRIPGDPPHLEIFTKVGHALPNTVRKTLAASTYLGKGRIKDAVRVMKRKGNLPKLEEALFRGGSKKGKVHPLRLSPLSPEEQEKRRKAKKTNDDDYQKAIDRENEGEDLGTRPKKRYFEEGRTAGEDIDACISRNIEHEESIEESFSGQVTRLKKWIKGRQRAKDASNKWTAASSKEQYNSQSYDRRGKNEYWEHRRSERDMERNAKSKSPAKRAQASSDKVRSDYHRDQWLKNAAKSGRARRKSDKLANYGWDAVNDHKKLPKFGRKKLEEGVVRKIKRALTSWKTKQDLEDKMSKESDKIDKKYNPFKLTRQERLQKDPARTKAYERLVTLGKRQSAMTGGNIFMPSWPKKPGDLKYMSKKKLEEASSISKKSLIKSLKKTQMQRDGYYDDDIIPRKPSKDLVNRWNSIGKKKKLEEAVSRKLIAKRNAEKQRTTYVVRKGEMPPIITPKSRYKFTEKELNKLKGILDKQKGRRTEAKAVAMQIKKKVKTVANVPDAPESSRASSVSVFSKLPSPGGHIHNAQPHVTDLVRAHQGKTPEKKKDTDGDFLRGFNTWTNEFARTGDAKYLDSAKRAALTHYASMIAKISHHPGHPEYDTARSNAKSMLDAHLDAIGQLRATIPAVPKPVNQKAGILSKIKKLFKENSEV